MGYMVSVYPLDDIVYRSRGNSKRRMSVGCQGSCVGIDGGCGGSRIYTITICVYICGGIPIGCCSTIGYVRGYGVVWMNHIK